MTLRHSGEEEKNLTTLRMPMPFRQQQQIEYLDDMIKQLRDMATKLGMHPVVSYLLSAASEEVAMTIRTRKARH